MYLSNIETFGDMMTKIKFIVLKMKKTRTRSKMRNNLNVFFQILWLASELFKIKRITKMRRMKYSGNRDLKKRLDSGNSILKKGVIHE